MKDESNSKIYSLHLSTWDTHQANLFSTDTDSNASALSVLSTDLISILSIITSSFSVFLTFYYITLYYRMHLRTWRVIRNLDKVFKWHHSQSTPASISKFLGLGYDVYTC